MIPVSTVTGPVVLLSVALALVQANADSDREYARGVELQQAGDLAGARQAYEAALKTSPRRVDALSNLGLVYAGLHDYARAIESFRKALQVAPGQPLVLYNLGITYLQSGRYENARGALSQAVAASNTNYMARHFLGLALLKLGRVREGIAELEVATRAQPEDLDAAFTLASAYLTNRQFDQAEAVIVGILRRHESAEAHLLAGSLYLAWKKYDEAVAELHRAQEMNPSMPELVSRLGEAYAMTGSRDIAIRVFEDHLKTNPSDFEALGFLGWLYLESNRLEEAAAVLNRARRMKPNDADLLYQLARLARAQENFEAAVPLLERVVAQRPEYTQAHLLLSQTYFRLNRLEDGKKEQVIANRLREQDRVKRVSEPAIRPVK